MPNSKGDKALSFDNTRTLLIDLSTKIGGASIRAINLAAAMPPGRAAIACLAGTPVMKLATQQNVKVYTVGRTKLDPGILVRLIRIARREGIQFFDAQNPQSKFWASLAARLSGVGLISTLNSWYLEENKGRWRRFFYHWIERITLPLTDMLIAVSLEIEHHLRKLDIGNLPVVVIPNAIALTTKAYETPKEQIIQTYNLPKRSTICCAVGRLTEAKGYQTLIDGMALLDPMFSCLIIGDGHLKERLTRRIHRLGLQHRIFLLGHLERRELLKIVSASDIFVMSSSTEGTPIALLEAAALGKPIVATAVGGIPDILTNNVSARLIKASEAKMLANAVLWMQRNPSKAFLLGQSARACVTDRYNVASQVAATLEAYRIAFAQKCQRE